MKGTRSELIQKLQDANRKLKAEVRQLRKQHKQSTDEILLLQELWQEDLAEVRAARRERIQKKREPLCPCCGNPTLDIKQLGMWKLVRCSSCDYFDRTKGNMEEYEESDDSDDSDDSAQGE